MAVVVVVVIIVIVIVIVIVVAVTGLVREYTRHGMVRYGIYSIHEMSLTRLILLADFT